MAEAIISSQEMQEMEMAVKSVNTVNSTHWGVQKFNQWCERKNKNINLATVDVGELADIFRRFYAEVRTLKGKPLSPSGMVGLRAALHWHITQAPISRNVNIVTNPAFITVNVMFDETLSSNP